MDRMDRATLESIIRQHLVAHEQIHDIRIPKIEELVKAIADDIEAGQKQ